jgi:hypothetical protein
MRDSLVKIVLLHRRFVANKKKGSKPLTKEEGNSKNKCLSLTYCNLRGSSTSNCKLRAPNPGSLKKGYEEISEGEI